jgi:hypothetical protein
VSPVGPGRDWLPGAGVAAVAADGLAVGAGDLAGAVGVDGQGPAEFVQDDVVVPSAVVLEVGQAGVAAVGAVGDVVGFTGRGGLVAAAGELARLVPQRDQAPQMDGDVVGLALVRIFVPMRAVGPHAVAAGLLRLVRAGAQDPASDLAELGGAGAAGGAQARALQGLRYAQTVA